jgi:general secretion pathway protein K
VTRGPESGVSLLNVLVVVAAASGLIQVMLAGQQSIAADLSRARDIAQAEALARGGIASVAVALRRDMADAPEVDHLQEEWATSAQQNVTFEFGSFAVEIDDARGRFNLNSLSAGAFQQQRVFEGLLAALDLPETLSGQIIMSLQNEGELRNADQLFQREFSQADIERLSPHVTALDTPGAINLNTATEPLLSALFANPSAAQALVARRSVSGQLTKQDLSALGLVPPALAGFTSDTFDIALRAQVGVARRALKRRILRGTKAGVLEITPID